MINLFIETDSCSMIYVSRIEAGRFYGYFSLCASRFEQVVEIHGKIAIA